MDLLFLLYPPPNGDPNATIYFLLVQFLFPAFVIWKLCFALRDLRLLRYGVLARGKLVDKTETMIPGTEESYLCRTLTFELEVGGKTYSVTVYRYGPAPPEGECEAMIYDPKLPWGVRTLDHFPELLKVTADGELEARPGTALHLLILPVLCVCLIATKMIALFARS